MEITSNLWFWFWRWLHVIAGVAWIGHLWFFNFVNASLQKDLTADVKKLVNPSLMLRSLFLFRWGAMLTYISGWGLIVLWGYMQKWAILFSNGLTSINDPANAPALWILVGMLFGTVMWFNVWFIIWPAQKKIIGAIQGGPAPDPSVGPRATLASKINTYLSVPLLLGMISAHTNSTFGSGLTGISLGIILGLLLVWVSYKFAPSISIKLVNG